MKVKILFITATLVFAGFAVKSQTTGSDNENERAMREQRNREAAQQANYALRKQILLLKDLDARSSRRQGNIALKSKPGVTKDDLAAVKINSEDLLLHKDFLKNSNAGIVRIQNGSVCSPESRVVRAEGNCPNNIVAKATAYSFRQVDYVSKALADVFYADGNFYSPGVYNLGIFANLGDVNIEKLTLTSDGVRQLIDFEPSSEQTDFNKQHLILTKGIQIGDYIYKREMPIEENNTYLLRTIAFNAKFPKVKSATQVRILDGDERKDVTLVFRLIRKHLDGSISLLWKSLQTKAAPKISIQENINTKKNLASRY